MKGSRARRTPNDEESPITKDSRARRTSEREELPSMKGSRIRRTLDHEGLPGTKGFRMRKVFAFGGFSGTNGFWMRRAFGRAWSTGQEMRSAALQRCPRKLLHKAELKFCTTEDLSDKEICSAALQCCPRKAAQVGPCVQAGFRVVGPVLRRNGVRKRCVSCKQMFGRVYCSVQKTVGNAHERTEAHASKRDRHQGCPRAQPEER